MIERKEIQSLVNLYRTELLDGVIPFGKNIPSTGITEGTLPAC